MSTDTNRFLSAGTKMLVKDTGAYRVFAGIINIPGPSLEMEPVETTELDPYQGSTTTPAAVQLIKTFVGGWTDLGELAFEMNMTSQEYAFALTNMLALSKLQWKIALRNGYTIGMTGLIKGLEGDLQIGELSKMTCTIKLTDGILFAQTGSVSELAW